MAGELGAGELGAGELQDAVVDRGWPNGGVAGALGRSWGGCLSRDLETVVGTSGDVWSCLVDELGTDLAVLSGSWGGSKHGPRGARCMSGDLCRTSVVRGLVESYSGIWMSR